ncbi:hypothetical protein GPALN_012377 [Globodera pallida]|nr:hypothetical protein GPALN_012377 [Globodera pallida]
MTKAGAEDGGSTMEPERRPGHILESYCGRKLTKACPGRVDPHEAAAKNFVQAMEILSEFIANEYPNAGVSLSSVYDATLSPDPPGQGTLSSTSARNSSPIYAPVASLVPLWTLRLPRPLSSSGFNDQYIGHEPPSRDDNVEGEPATIPAQVDDEGDRPVVPQRRHNHPPLSDYLMSHLGLQIEG